MATSTKTMKRQITSDAEFRDFVQQIHDGLTAVGMVQEAQTGQINPSTVNRPGSTGTKAGFEVWRFPDSALQTALPIYMLINYGTGTGGSGLSIPTIWVQCGTGANGAGVLTGQVGIENRMRAAAFDATSVSSFFCLTDGALVMALWAGHRTYARVVAIERSNDGTGEYDSDHFAVVWLSQTDGPVNQVIPAAGTVPYIHEIGAGDAGVMGVGGAIAGNALTTDSRPGTSDKVVLPLFVVFGWLDQPLLGLVGGLIAERTIGDTLAIDRYGGAVTPTYKWIANPTTVITGSNTPTNNAGTNGYLLGMVWE